MCYDVSNFWGDSRELVEQLAECVDVYTEDVGIGHYECHGATGFDSQIETKFDSDSLTVSYDPEAEEILRKGEETISIDVRDEMKEMIVSYDLEKVEKNSVGVLVATYYVEHKGWA